MVVSALPGDESRQTDAAPYTLESRRVEQRRPARLDREKCEANVSLFHRLFQRIKCALVFAEAPGARARDGREGRNGAALEFAARAARAARRCCCQKRRE